ncbi:MAG: ABC transporter ATP-binding protein, partial [Rudaea sp.]
ALNDYSGALVLVSHDRSLIRTCCDTLLHVGGGRITDYAGDLDDYSRAVQRENTEAPAGATNAGAPTSSGRRRDERRERAEQRAKLAPLRKEIQRIEQRMAALEKEKQTLGSKLADPQLYATASTAQMLDLSQRAAVLGNEIGALEHAWLAAQQELDQAAIA